MRWQILWRIAFFFFQFSLRNLSYLGKTLKSIFGVKCSFFQRRLQFFLEEICSLVDSWCSLKKEIYFTCENMGIWPQNYKCKFALKVVLKIFLGSNAHFFTWKVYIFFWGRKNIYCRTYQNKKKWVSILKKKLFDPIHTFRGFSQNWKKKNAIHRKTCYDILS